MRAPVLAVGDGALGFWVAVRAVFPDTKEQRCWFHLSANVLNCLPASAQPGARAALPEIFKAEDREHALKAVKAFESDYGVRWHKAIAKITDHVDVLLEFYNYPAESTGSICADQPDRIDLRDRQAAQRVTRVPDREPPGWSWPSSGVRAGPLADGERATLGRARPSRSHLREGQLVERPDVSGGEQMIA